MFARLMPSEGRFFALFDQHAEKIVEGARALSVLMSGDGDLKAQSDAIATIEKAADKIARETLMLLHKTFITPLDRNEIHTLITRLDDILDAIEDAAHAMSLYDVRDPTAAARVLATLCLASAEKVKSAVSVLADGEQTAKLMALCEEIDHLEGEADGVMRTAMAELFGNERDPFRVIKLKELYQMLELVTDRCQDVANTLESIVLERA